MGSGLCYYPHGRDRDASLYFYCLIDIWSGEEVADVAAAYVVEDESRLQIYLVLTAPAVITRELAVVEVGVGSWEIYCISKIQVFRIWYTLRQILITDFFNCLVTEFTDYGSHRYLCITK